MAPRADEMAPPHGRARARLLAGIETGIVGGIAMLLYFSGLSFLQRQQWWTAENLLGSAVYGNAAIWKGLGRATMAGAAVQLVLASLCGIAFSFTISFLRVGSVFRLSAAVAAATGWYFLFYNWIFPAVAPLIPMYSSRSAPLVAHLLLGLSLSRAHSSYERIVRIMRPPG